jgi:transcription termination factor Rho
MSVLDRDALQASPLADLHAIASELSIDGYRRLRKAQLIDAILDKQSGVERPAADDDEPADAPEPAEPQAPAGEESDEGDDERGASRRRRGRRGGRGRSRADSGEADGDREERSRSDEPAAATAREPESRAAEPEPQEEMVEGVVELLANGSGFVRVVPPEPADDDVYISSAQVKRCELVSGDKIAGPKRAPRRSERFASLIRVETINGRPAAELADGVRFDDLPVAWASEQLKLGSDDPTLKAIDWLTPIGKGSRVVICGEAHAGKSHTLRRVAEALAGHDNLSLQVVLAGIRPEEVTDWNDGKVAPVAAVSFAASEDAQNGAVEPAIDQARRLAARGSDAVVLIDSLDGVSPSLARKALGSARNIVDGGSLTVIATAAQPLGGETTVIEVDRELTGVGRFPAINVFASGTLRPELLVGEEGAQTIVRMRVQATEIAGE